MIELLGSVELLGGALLPYVVVGFVANGGGPAIVASAALGADGFIRIVGGGVAARKAEASDDIRRLIRSRRIAVGRVLLGLLLVPVLVVGSSDNRIGAAATLAILAGLSGLSLFESQDKFFLRRLFTHSGRASHARFNALRQFFGRGVLVAAPLAVGVATNSLYGAAVISLAVIAPMLAGLSSTAALRYLSTMSSSDEVVVEAAAGLAVEQEPASTATVGSDRTVSRKASSRWLVVMTASMNWWLGGVALALALTAPSSLAWFYGATLFSLTIASLVGLELDRWVERQHVEVSFVAVCVGLAGYGVQIGFTSIGFLLLAGSAYGLLVTFLPTWTVKALGGSDEATLIMRSERAGRIAAIASVFAYGIVIDFGGRPSILVTMGAVALLVTVLGGRQVMSQRERPSILFERPT